jgi:transcriptional regulator with XRE-family HTH domain
MNIFKIRLKELIEAKSITQTKICHELNISKQKLSNWKSGYSEPDMDDLILLSDYLSVSVDYLLGKDN